MSELTTLQRENHQQSKGAEKLQRVEDLSQKIIEEADLILQLEDRQEATTRLDALNEQTFDGQLLSMINELLASEQGEVEHLQQMT